MSAADPPRLSHVDADGRPAMVDVSDKQVTLRTAHARAIVELPPEVAAAIDGGELVTKKGPVFQTAIVAGTMACKRTAELIPFCHPLAIEGCKIDIRLDDARRAVVDCRVKLHHRTGVEMEALTGASVAALTIYDMCKALSHQIVIRDVRLIEKTGGKRDVHSD